MRLLIPFALAPALLSLLCACASAPAPSPVAYTMIANATSGVEMPRIGLPGRPDVEQRVNEQLDSLAASFVCEGVEMDGENAWYEANVVVAHAADDVFSVGIGAGYYCGGPYPTNRADVSITFDLRSGEAVGFRALFADYKRDRAGIARAFVERLAPEDLDGCEDVLTVEELAERSFAYTISSDGLRMEPVFPHVIEACSRDQIVPFDALRAFAAPGGILARVAAAHP